MTDLYTRLFIALGIAVCLFSIFHLQTGKLDLRFLLLALVTISLSSHIFVQIPGITSQISVSDTFVFLTLLLYDGEAAILLSTVEAFFTTLRFSKKPRTLLFNSAATACSTFVTVQALRLFFGSIVALPNGEYSSQFITALGVMALVQYISNSGSVAVVAALKNNRPIWQTWVKNYLWTSITYFAGASAAGLVAKLSGTVGLYALIVTTPIVAIVFFTYRTYLKNVESAAAQAAQAERHVAELNHYIAEQERISEQFSQLEKLSALGELASGVAHDFNNTLAGILGRAQLMLRTDDPEKIKRGLEIIIRSAEDGAKTVKRIQDFARQRRDHDFALVNVDQLLQDVSEITRPRWKDRAEASNVHISLELQIRSNALIMGDDSELREVLVNMVFNAVDAMPSGGTLTLSAEEVDSSIEIAVSDTGTGMSEEVRSRIFDPFFTTKGKAGLGLGLVVSYGIIRRHEGTVEAESEVGRGTTFKIRLPIAKGAVETRPGDESVGSVVSILDGAMAASSSLAVVKQPRVLVVDDEEHVRELLRDILESEGCQAILADGGPKALTLFNSGKFDAVFTDIGMPEMSGWELAHVIRERDESVPLAVITGWGEAVGSSEQREAQVDWVVTKPFDITRIAELAQEITKRRADALKTTTLTVAA
ncbi:MAG TPA: ATP-binding protein [Pyrinomonadaceae bacterium]|nr:ATP-binding protein [Pyrinomonadaceae bacterium]